MKTAYAISRYAVAFLIITYGFAKLNGAQFTILQSELDKPMGEVSGFWLTWYYFGYSKFYGNFIALVQVLGGLSLIFRKTTLLGACVLLPVVTNIILVDVFYGIASGALQVALLIEAALVLILATHRREIFDLFWAKQNSRFPSGRDARPGKLMACALLILIPFAFTYWGANYNNRSPTPIDGAWGVVETSPEADRGSGDGMPSVIFFERNRAHMCVFKHGEGTEARYEQHHFEVDPDARSVKIWKTWLDKGPEIFDGGYELSGERLRLSGEFADGRGSTTVVLRRLD